MTPAGYSGAPLPKKLGIKPDARVLLIDAPDGFERTLGARGLATVLVDNKVCAVDATWSGLRFVRRLSDR